MKEMVEFFKEIFMINREDKTFVGLSQFRYAKETVSVKPKAPVKKSEVKLSDLMKKTS